MFYNLPCDCTTMVPLLKAQAQNLFSHQRVQVYHEGHRGARLQEQGDSCPVENTRKRKYSGFFNDVTESASQIKGVKIPSTIFPTRVEAKSLTTGGPVL